MPIPRKYRLNVRRNVPDQVDMETWTGLGRGSGVHDVIGSQLGIGTVHLIRKSPDHLRVSGDPLSNRSQNLELQACWILYGAVDCLSD